MHILYKYFLLKLFHDSQYMLYNQLYKFVNAKKLSGKIVEQVFKKLTFFKDSFNLLANFKELLNKICWTIKWMVDITKWTRYFILTIL